MKRPPSELVPRPLPLVLLLRRGVAFLLLAACSGACSPLLPPAAAAERPNFVWLLSEDNSKHYLRHFDPLGAAAPQIEAMAAHGITFDRAYSCSPVCSVARTTLMTSVYAPRIGAQYHRKIKPVVLPEGWELFPAYLRQAGYYTTNNSKKDYNVLEGDVWDESSRKATWSNRPDPATPFFHMQSYPVSHESSLHFSRAQLRRDAPQTDPGSVQLAPYHPDTELFRLTYARYHDRIRKVDEIVGQVLAQLKQEGLLEDTFVFYFGDHGGVLPGSKGYVHESGVHVPLVVRIPENWRHLIDRPPGTRAGGTVSFVDFGPTVLHLAGVKVPAHVDGTPFLGPDVKREDVERRDEAFNYADRFDEKYDFCRALRKGRWKYVRNYQAYYPDSLQNNYRYKMLAYQEWRQLYRDGKLDAAQRRFFEPKPAEELYDLEQDPHQTHNLAVDPDYAERLAALRRRLQERVKSLGDLSFFPESVLVAQGVQDPLAFSRRQRQRIGQLIDTADLVLLPFSEARPRLEQALSSEDQWIRYWALIGCAVWGEQARPLVSRARELLDDPEHLVQLRAAEFLAIVGAENPGHALKRILRESADPVVALLTLNSAVYVRDHLRLNLDLSQADVRARSDLVARRLEYLTNRQGSGD